MWNEQRAVDVKTNRRKIIFHFLGTDSEMAVVEMNVVTILIEIETIFETVPLDITHSKLQYLILPSATHLR